jgi:LysM domain
MSALSAFEAGFGEVGIPRTGMTLPPRPDIQVVTGSPRPAPAPPRGNVTTARPDRGRPEARPAASQKRTAGRAGTAAPLRLTRRGRVVVAVFAVVLATVIISVIAMAVAGGAQASNHGRDGAGYAGMRQIVVRPGETLWTIATAAEPSADPRLVISQIMTVNSLTSTVVEAGELLWVPK